MSSNSLLYLVIPEERTSKECSPPSAKSCLGRRYIAAVRGLDICKVNTDLTVHRGSFRQGTLGSSVPKEKGRGLLYLLFALPLWQSFLVTQLTLQSNILDISQSIGYIRFTRILLTSSNQLIMPAGSHTVSLISCIGVNL